MWRLRRKRQELLNALALDELDEYRAAVGRIIGVAPMLPAQPMAADVPPNAPDWIQQTPAWPTNCPADSRLSSPRDNRRRW